MAFNHEANVDCEDKKPRILIVEDSTDIRELLEIYFGNQDKYDVVFASTGAEALNIFTASFRCCENTGVLMDLVLPDINGLRLLSAMRELEKGSASGCVASRFGLISANATVVEGTDLLHKVGLTLRLDKPFSVEMLIKKIDAWISAPPPDLYSLCAAAG